MARVDLGRVVGDSAYEVAVKEGFVGSEQEWLDSLKGEDGSQVTVSSTGTSENEVQYITIDNVEYKLAGGAESPLYSVSYNNYDPDSDWDALNDAFFGGKIVRVGYNGTYIYTAAYEDWDGTDVIAFKDTDAWEQDNVVNIQVSKVYLGDGIKNDESYVISQEQGPGPGPSWDWEHTWVSDNSGVEASISDDGHTVEFINFNFTDTPFLFMPTSMADITVGANGGPNQNANGEFDMSQNGYIMGDAQADWSIYCDAINQKLVLKSPAGGPDFHNFSSFYVSGKGMMAQQ